MKTGRDAMQSRFLNRDTFINVLPNTNQMTNRARIDEKKSILRVLIVDDDKKFLDLFSSLISLMGFEAVISDRGDKALTQLLKSRFDLVFTDLNMNGMDGWSLARQIKDISPKTPVVLVTAEATDLVLKKIENSSVDLVLFKPFGFGEFQKMVQKMLRIT
jgi:two-component system capsular synthesis sensor histidine kinase RcsC